MMKLSVLVLSIFFLLPATAAEKEKPTKISPRIYKKLKKTETLIAKKSYQQAEQNLKSLAAKTDPNTYEQAIVLRSLSSVYALQGQYKKAAKALSNCLALNVLPKPQELQSTLNLGQLYMAVEHYRKAINILEPWLAQNSNPNAQINILLANAYAQLKQFRKALPHIKRAISRSKKPEEAWYQLNLALYFELEQYGQAAKLLKTMVNRYPNKKSYWDQLSSTYQQLKQYKKAVSIKHLAYKKGFLTTEKEIQDLANLFIYIKHPYKAATLLKKEISNKRIKSNSKNWESLANAWTIAKEYDYAIKALEVASKLNNKGSLYQRLGRIYVEQEKWKKATAYLGKALDKGGLKNAGMAHLLLGMSYFELNNLKQAKRYFLNAAKYNKNKKAAVQWLNYINQSSPNIS